MSWPGASRVRFSPPPCTSIQLPVKRRIVDLPGGVPARTQVPLRVLLALLGGGVAVVQIARACIAAVGGLRALVLHLLRDGLYRDVVGVLRVLRQRRASRPAVATGANRGAQRPFQLGDRQL